MALTTEWQTFTFTFVPKETSRKARFDLGGFKEGHIYDFRDASLKPGGNLELSENQTLRSGTIPLIVKEGYFQPTGFSGVSIFFAKRGTRRFL